MKRMRLMAARLLRKENVDPADPAESLLPYTNKLNYHKKLQETKKKTKKHGSFDHKHLKITKSTKNTS